MNPLILEGLSDALGFIGGALLAYWLARMLGFDAMADGYGSGALGGIVAVGLGGGAGLQLARRWRAARKKDQ
jgi:hypothetical protein